MRGLVLAVIMALTGCAGLNNTLGIQTDDYHVSMCGSGIVTIPCHDIGKVAVPVGGESIVTIAAALAGPYLAQQQNLKSCAFTTYPEAADASGFTVTASAVCKLNGVPVTEMVTLQFEPVTP